MSTQIPTPRTDAQNFFFIEGSLGHTETGVDVDFARDLERELITAESKLAQVYQWIERNSQDGFIDSQSYFQNLERVGDRIKDERDEARHKIESVMREKGQRIEELKGHLQSLKDDMSLRLVELERVEQDLNEARKDAERMYDALQKYGEPGKLHEFHNMRDAAFREHDTLTTKTKQP